MADRVLRWVEGHKNPDLPVYWSQVKKAKVGAKEREVSIGSDRNSLFTKRVPNPAFVPADQRAGKTITAEQRREFTQEAALTEEQQSTLRTEVERVLGLVQAIADGEVTSFFYSAESNSFRYTQDTEVDGAKQSESLTSDDETLLEAGNAFAQKVAEVVAKQDKPLQVHEGPAA